MSHTQNSFWDKLLSKGDLTINLEHGIQFPFENISSPKKQVDKILKYKNQFSLTNASNKPNPIADEKMSIIAEALSEVVKEYMDKKTEQEEEDDY